MTLPDFAEQLISAGVELVQYRDKAGTPQQVLQAAQTLRTMAPATRCRLVLNDRADLAGLAAFDGVHVGQGDLAPNDARRVVGTGRVVGVSTHNEQQIRIANATDADYIAIGPVFATSTKLNPDPVIGLDGVRRARALTSKPLIAIGGITRANARSVLDAGATSVAVISGLFAPGEPIAHVVRDFHAILR